MKSPSPKEKMNNEKHVTPEKVFTSANLLSKYLEGKIKVSTSTVSV
jgi:hypothetical protein